MMKCEKCGRELDESKFKLTRWGTYAKVCNECVTNARIQTMKKNKSEAIQGQRTTRLSDFTPRELMEELARRGYEGKLTYVETHVIDITNF